MKFTIEMVDVGDADCFLISFADSSNKKDLNIIIDGGKESLLNSRYRSLDVFLEEKHSDMVIDGIVVTHIDDDHIGGILRFFNSLLLTKKETLQSMFIVYNDYDENFISTRQASDLRKSITKMKERLKTYNNTCVTNPVHLLKLKSYEQDYDSLNASINTKLRDDALPIVFFSISKRRHLLLENLEDDKVYITFLTPDYPELKSFMYKWRALRTPDKGKIDAKVVNNSSISILIEFGGKKVLMTGDAYISKVTTALESIGFDKIGSIDYIKLAHHGARNNNIGLINLAKKTNCCRFFVSANGKDAHPDKDMIEEIRAEMGSKVQISATNQLAGTDYLEVENILSVNGG